MTNTTSPPQNTTKDPYAEHTTLKKEKITDIQTPKFDKWAMRIYEQGKKDGVNMMFAKIAELAEPDERQFGAGDLNTNLDYIHEIRENIIKSKY